MYVKYRNIDFIYNENNVTEEEIKAYFDKVLDIAENIVNISEIDIEDNFETSYIYILKEDDVDVWDRQTLDFSKELALHHIEHATADEDYGEEFDVIILYND